MDTDVGVEIDNINDGHVFSETSEVYAFHIGEICVPSSDYPLLS